jgi:hypothetical protein
VAVRIPLPFTRCHPASPKAAAVRLSYSKTYGAYQNSVLSLPRVATHHKDCEVRSQHDRVAVCGDYSLSAARVKNSSREGTSAGSRRRECCLGISGASDAIFIISAAGAPVGDWMNPFTQ